MVTINEKKHVSPSIFELDKQNIFLYPTLPPLNKARTVKEKWIILIAKAKGIINYLYKKIEHYTQKN